MIVASALVVLYLVWSQYIRKLKPGQARLSNFKFALYAAIAVVILAVFAYQAATKGRLTMVRKVPMGTVIMIVLLAVFYIQNIGTLNVYTAHNQIGLFSVAAILVGGASVNKATVSQAIMGTLLFHSMFILSPEIGQAVFGQAILGEYFRTFMVYGVIGLSLGLYVWKANKQSKLTLEPRVAENARDQVINSGTTR